jgi:outer membrane receptor protein involved in Fe transport
MNHVPLRRFPRTLWALLFFFTIGSLFAQSGTVSVDFKNASPAEIIKNLESRTPYRFVYPEGLDLSGPAITIKKENVSIDEVLKVLRLQTNLDFRRTENNIAVNKKQNTKKPGKITGKVIDESGLSLPGATIRVIETGTTTVADNYGNYSLSLNPGSYTIEVILMFFQTKKITDVVVKNKEETILNIALKEDVNALEEVVITQSYKKATSTSDGLLQQQKKAAQMSDGISAEQIAKTPDNDVGATLKRITGITTVDNKYVVVRSMGERWNQAVMDGINLPSTEAYNNNFSFDIIPTSMVESVIVSKTVTPDMNASFAGGYVEIRTKDIPEKDFFSFNWGSSYNDLSTSKQFLTRQRGKNDYFGFDDGTRDFPKGLEPMDWNNPLFFEQSKQFTNDNFTTYSTKANPGSSFQLAFGKNFELKNNNKWGFVGAITSRNEQTKLDIDHTGRGNWLDTTGQISEEQQQGLAPVDFFNFKNKGASYTYNSTVAGMLNFGLQWGRNRISLRNSYTHIYDNTLTRVTGWNEYITGQPSGAESSYNYFYYGIIPNNDPAQVQSLDKPYTDNTDYPIYQTLLQNKIEGNHKIGNTEFSWFAARTGIAADTKDYTQHQTYYNFIGNEILAYHQVYNSGNNFSRGYIENSETDYNYGTSFKWSMDAGDIKNSIKLGYAGALKNNTNQQQKFFLRVDENRDVPNNEKNFLIMEGALSNWFDGSHYVPGGIGWQTNALYKNEKYEGKVTQHAPYLMFDNRWNNKLRLVWGIRAEYFKYDLISQQIDLADPRNVNREAIDDKPWQFMPSANFTYSPTSKTNIRLAYGRTVIRPQFNERTGLPYFDPIANGLIYNTEMTSSVINNYDFKFEWFSGPGEIISAGLYYKDIDRPIEREGHLSNEGNLFLYNGNSKNAKLTGFEVEIRKNFGFIVKDSFLEHLFISGNFTFNDTKVISFKNLYNTGANAETYNVQRPLYGQTPWAYNLGLMYDGNRFGANFLYNAKGDQYITVGYDYNGEEIQRPYAVADMQLSYKFLKHKNFEIKLNARNLFNRVKEYYNNYNSYSVFKGAGNEFETIRENLSLMPGATDKYDKSIDKILFRAYSGRTFSLNMIYSF